MVINEVLSKILKRIYGWRRSKLWSNMTGRTVVILGCTGTGKSDLGIAIAKHFNGEIISADSMQIYKGLDIATNKVTLDEMDGIPHHMMSFVDPSCSAFNVHKYRELVLPIMESLWKQNKLPVIVGGTTYYIESVLYKDNLVATNTYQNESENLEKYSNEELYERLKEIDPISASQVHKNNRYRVIRAIKIFELTGHRKSDIIEAQHENSESELGGKLRYPNSLVFYLDAQKDVLIERNNIRVDKMVDKGLRKEIEHFQDKAILKLSQ